MQFYELVHFIQRRKKFLLLSFFCLILFGWIVFKVLPRFGPPQFQMPVTIVEITRPSVETLKTEIYAIGTLKAYESVDIEPEISGKIEKIFFEDGQSIKAEQILVQLDDALERAKVNQTRAKLKFSESNYERNKKLFESKTISKQVLEEAFAEMEVKRAEYEMSQVNLEKTKLISPISGIVGLRSHSPGDYVSPGNTLAQVNTLNPLKLDFEIPSNYVGIVKKNQKLTFYSNAFSDKIFHSYIVAIDPNVKINSRSFRVRSKIENHDLILKPGLYVKVALELAKAENALMIPEQAVFSTQQGDYVFLLKDQKSIQQKVTLGERKDNKVQILSGIEKEDLIILSGQLKLKDGLAVEYKPKQIPK